MLIQLTGMLNAALPYLSGALEILILAFLIYKVLYYLRGTRGAYVLAGLMLILLALAAVAELLKLEVIRWLMDDLGRSMALAGIVLFQPELRRALAQLGTYTFWRSNRKREMLGEVVTAVQNMSRRKIGALIVIERRIGLRTMIEDAVKIDVKVNALMLESIFFPNSPLHDGAVVIRDDRIVAARVILPLSRDDSISKRLGTRHRAAVGITEETDAVVVLASEESGTIGVASHGILRRGFGAESLRNYLEQLLVHGEELPDENELADTGDGDAGDMVTSEHAGGEDGEKKS